MESFEESNASKDNLLEPPNINDSTTDEEDVKATIKPRLSPLPRRRSSVSSDDGDLEPPPTVARKVSFADAFGFDLVSVKEFDTWEIPIVTPSFVMESITIEEFYLSPSFTLPPVGVIMERLHLKKVTLESVDFIPGTSSMKGIIRVLNISFEKQVYVRMSLDSWQSYYDLLAEYVPDSCNGETDQFFFTISLVSPFQKEGARVDFCICYETAVGSFWDNNDGLNYVLTCHKKEKIVEVEKPSDEIIDKNKKSCLKPSLSKEDEDTDVFQEENPAATEKYIPRIICSHDDFSGDNNDEENEDKSKEKNNEDESDVELFLSQRLMNAKITSSEENYSTGFSEKTISSNDRQPNKEIQYLKNPIADTLDYNSQQLEECYNSGEYLPITEVTGSKDTKDFISLISSNSHNEHHKEFTKTQECLDTSEERDLHDSKLNEQEKLSPGLMNEVSSREPCQWSSAEQLSEDSKSDSCLKISENSCIAPADTRQLTESEEILDNNANPHVSQSIATLPYFSAQDTKGIKDKQNEKSKSETIENDTRLPVTTEHTEPEHLTLFSQKEDFQNISYEYTLSKISVLEKENIEPNEKVFSLTPSGDAYLFREGQVRDIGKDESTQNTDVNPSLCKDTKHDFTKLPDDKQYITTEKDLELSHSNIKPASLSEQYYITAQESHCDQADEKLQVNDNKDVVSEKGDHIFSSERAVYDSEKESSVPDFSPSIASTAAENVTQNTFHEWNAILGSLPSEQTQGNKVIIAKITEEKGQSQTRSQDRKASKGSYMDIGFSEIKRAQQGIDEKLKEKVTFVSGKNIEVVSENFVSGHKEKVENLAEENISHLYSQDIVYGGAAYVSRGEDELEHYDHRSNYLIGESVVERDVTVNQCSDGSTALGQDVDLRSEEDVIANKETENFTDLSQPIIIEDIENIDNVQANMEERYAAPSILISEPDDEGNAQNFEPEQSKEEETICYYDDDQTSTMATEPITMGHVSSKVICFIMFVVFAGLMYHFDFLVCFALYLFSLYWLYWEGDRNKSPVRKE